MGKPHGTLIKQHGFKGELLLKGEPYFLNNIEKGMYLFIEINGQSIPFFIEEFTPDVSGEKGFIKLEFIDSDTEARKYISCNVYSDLYIEEISENSTHLSDLIGYLVKDIKTGFEFPVIDFFENSENPILVLDNKGQEILLPRNADYIVAIDQQNRIISVDLPEGFMLV